MGTKTKDKRTRFERHVQRVKRQIGFLIAIGASNRCIKREIELDPGQVERSGG